VLNINQPINQSTKHTIEEIIFSVSIKEHSDTENYRSVLRQIYYDVINKKDKVSFEGLVIHCH
jgi:hypothetical protein